ncbi:unnamed protein product, partial [Iphiclides podalirius]
MDTKAILLSICVVFAGHVYATDIPERGGLNFIKLAADYGYVAEQYEIVTEDGYKLQLFHIPGKGKTPVLLMHGIFDSSDTWIARGNASLAIALADRGYDVWAGNCRGNRYGRGHVSLNPDLDAEFWAFTFHEIGYYDLPAIIDTVLNHTAADKVDAVGHSQGNTVFYVLASARPEYNGKVNLLIALAPVCFLNNVPPPLSTVIDRSPMLYEIAKHLNLQELFQENSVFIVTWRKLCPIPIIGYTACILGNVFPIIGYDDEEMEVDFIRTLVEYFPSGSSTKNLYHFAQVAMRGQFARFDYGTEANLVVYNSSAPLEYELSAVSFKVALFVGANDGLSTLDDVAILRQRLPNVVQYLLIPRKKMNHADFLLGRNMGKYLFPYIIDALEKNEGIL